MDFSFGPDTRLWMVRSDAGTWYDFFRDEGVVALGWRDLAEAAVSGATRETLLARYQALEPHVKPGTIRSGVAQVLRFIQQVSIGDAVLTYSPSNRLYSLGLVTGAVEYRSQWYTQDVPLVRRVQWHVREVPRDQLSQAARNSLGSTLTLFEVPAAVARELYLALNSSGDEKVASSLGDATPSVFNPVSTVLVAEESLSLGTSYEELPDPLADLETRALESIKDLVNELSWDDMQELIAGILRAMGYRTQVSPPGADRGKDIMASPDGFGFEHPRIMVEVKHRKGQMGSQAIRSFLGGRHKDDRGLYVSTGGFTKDAHYEADRSAIPLNLWTLDHVVRALIDHYDATDAQTKRLVPLKRLYWPA